MRVLVTGGAGFIGHHVVRRLVAEGHEVAILDNLRRGSFERPGLEAARLIEGDIRRIDECTKAVAGCEAVVHLAAQANVIGSAGAPQYAFETNVDGTWNIACAAERAGVRHFVFSSSREVYGEPASLPVAESAPYAPKNVYGATKVAGEALLRTMPKEQMAVSVLRLTNVIGTGDSERVLPNWVKAAASGEPLILFGGDQEMDFVPVELVAEAIVRLLKTGPCAEPVNIGSGRSLPLREVANRVLALAPTESRVEVVPARAIEVRRFEADTRRMEEWLGIAPPDDPLAGLGAIAAASEWR